MYPEDIPGNVAQVKKTKRDRAQRYNQAEACTAAPGPAGVLCGAGGVAATRLSGRRRGSRAGGAAIRPAARLSGQRRGYQAGGAALRPAARSSGRRRRSQAGGAASLWCPAYVVFVDRLLVCARFALALSSPPCPVLAGALGDN